MRMVQYIDITEWVYWKLTSKINIYCKQRDEHITYYQYLSLKTKTSHLKYRISQKCEAVMHGSIFMIVNNSLEDLVNDCCSRLLIIIN